MHCNWKQDHPCITAESRTIHALQLKAGPSMHYSWKQCHPCTTAESRTIQALQLTAEPSMHCNWKQYHPCTTSESRTIHALQLKAGPTMHWLAVHGAWGGAYWTNPQATRNISLYDRLFSLSLRGIYTSDFVLRPRFWRERYKTSWKASLKMCINIF